ncbi:uncharacterized protein J8A68_002004 [[Candida] subhashii]|uniref:CBS domain-containing protein n=1 Tax=[Candida] subhashii TaxID=561895 RepID=A0A8J5QQ82_9ASCO|nr:uncharacterized protein J8A68_002004 [[Candida] subhashii]KAG7664448.1 hypothetical protein J8A68_002004 [[Candida] subhashii]
MSLTIITYGCKVPAGIFVPSMAAGATFGRALGVIADMIYQSHPNAGYFQTCPQDGSPCIIPGTYAFLGAAAGLCGITDLTVTVVIIMFELTGALRFIVPTMIVVAVTKGINDRWGHGGIAEQMIRFNGLPYMDSKEDFVFAVTVEAAMSNVVVAFSSEDDDANGGMRLGDVRKVLAKCEYKGFPIVVSGRNPKLYGFIPRYDLEYVLKSYGGYDENTSTLKSSLSSRLLQQLKSRSVNRSPVSVNLGASLEFVGDIFAKVGPRYILVEKDNGTLVGIITKKDILRYEFAMEHAETGQKEQAQKSNEEQVDAKIWEFMVVIGTSARKNLGKLLHNDANRYIT